MATEQQHIELAEELAEIRADLDRTRAGLAYTYSRLRQATGLYAPTATALVDKVVQQIAGHAAERDEVLRTAHRDRLAADGAIDRIEQLVGERNQAERDVDRLTKRLDGIEAWVTSDPVTAKNAFGEGYREAMRDVRDLMRKDDS